MGDDNATNATTTQAESTTVAPEETTSSSTIDSGIGGETTSVSSEETTSSSTIDSGIGGESTPIPGGSMPADVGDAIAVGEAAVLDDGVLDAYRVQPEASPESGLFSGLSLPAVAALALLSVVPFGAQQLRQWNQRP